MTPTPRALHTRLPALSPQEARARNGWLAALDGQPLDGGRLAVQVSVMEGPSGPGLAFAAGPATLHLFGEMLDGQPIHDLSEGPALPEALVELSRLEPLIALIERVCGRSLDPVGIAPPPPGLSLHLTVDDKDGTVRHRARLVAPFDMSPPSAPPRSNAVRLARLRTACRLRLRGPAPRRGELAALEAGDIVVLPHRAGLLDASLTVGNTVWRGGFSREGAFTAREEGTRMLDEPPSQDPPASDAPSPAPEPPPSAAALQRLAELPVRLQVVLPDLQVSVGDLAGLAPGSVTALPLKGDDLPVRLLADEVEIASGRLVSLGDAYGVLIDAVRGPTAAIPSHGEADGQG